MNLWFRHLEGRKEAPFSVLEVLNRKYRLWLITVEHMQHTTRYGTETVLQQHPPFIKSKEANVRLQESYRFYM
jgi:hypothetical protein